MTAFALSCPVPLAGDETIQVAHGGGGRATERLLDTIFRPAFDGPELARRHDGARLDLAGPVAFTTDSYVVKPLFFPGGDIGTLAVNGTVNDLAMCGARPAYLSAGFILEEGLDTTFLGRIVGSMRDAARPPACALLPVTSRWSIAARPTASSSTRPGSGRSLPAIRSSRRAAGPAMR